MNLTNKLRTGALAAGLVTALSLSACTDGELVGIGNSPPLVFMPRILEPGAIRDARENEQARDAKYRARLSQRGIVVTTPQGYQVNLDKYVNVMHGGKEYSIWEINPPDITLAPLVGALWDPRYGVTIPIKELDMMQE